MHSQPETLKLLEDGLCNRSLTNKAREAAFLVRIRYFKMTLEKKIAKVCIKVLGGLYMKAEKYVLEPTDTILGISINKDLQTYTRKDLCKEFDTSLSQNSGTFYNLPSTQKIRLGVQIMRNNEEDREIDLIFRQKLGDKKGCRYENKNKVDYL